MNKEEFMAELFGAIADFRKERNPRDFLNYIKGEAFLLNHLFDMGGKGTPSSLANCLDVSAARVAAILRSLEKKHLIGRTADEGDRRKVLVELTQKGSEYVEHIRREIADHCFALFEVLGEEDMAQLIRILKKLSVSDKNVCDGISHTDKTMQIQDHIITKDAGDSSETQN